MKLQGRTLQVGMRGDDVAELHQELRRLGIEVTERELADKHFGVATAQAVGEFQRMRGLWQSAVVDEWTASALTEAVAAAPPLAVPVPVAPTPAAVAPPLPAPPPVEKP